MAATSTFEVILIDAANVKGIDVGDANPEIRHVICKLLAIDQYDALLDPFYIFHRIRRETRGRDEYTFASALSVKATGESLNYWSAHRVFPAFGLNEHEVKSESIFLDDAIDSTIATFPNGQTCIIA